MKGEATTRDRRQLVELARQAAAVTEQQARQQAQERAVEGGEGAVEVGDLVAFPWDGAPGDGAPGDGAAPLEWAVLHQVEDRRLLVPADTAPFSSDEDLTTDGAAGPLALRCGWGRWVPATTLADLPVTGTLEPATVATARAMATALEGSPSKGRGEGSPGYRHWIESAIAPACGRLDAEARASQSGASQTETKTTRPWPWALPFAASLILALGAGLVLGNLFPRPLTPTETPPATSSVTPSATHAFLHPAEGRRGGATEIQLPAGSSLVLLVAITDPVPLAREVEIQLQRLDGEEITLWSGKSSQSTAGEIQVVVPSSLLPAGSYRLRKGEAGGHEDFYFEVLP